MRNQKDRNSQTLEDNVDEQSKDKVAANSKDKVDAKPKKQGHQQLVPGFCFKAKTRPSTNRTGFYVLKAKQGHQQISREARVVQQTGRWKINRQGR